MQDKPEVVAVEREGDPTPTIKSMPWYEAVAVRVARTYLQSLVGLTATFLILPAQMPSPVGNPYMLGPLTASFLIAAQFALAPAALALLQNLLELLTKLDQSLPKLRA